MTPEETAAATAQAIVQAGTGFMTNPSTFAHGGDLGFSGLDFYVVGRGGVLGDTSADVVAAAFVFWSPEVIRKAWDAGREVMPPFSAAEEFAIAGHKWAEATWPDGVDYDRLAELAGRVAEGADFAGAPLFAGWRLLDVPTSPKAHVLHYLNGLRELRGAIHAGAVLAAGLRPTEAVAISAPYMAKIYGWGELTADPAKKPVWDQAEAATNRGIAAAFEILDETERDELATLANATLPAA
ncbi:MAG TPA: hypothetical protein VHN98_07560 [Acidimicrobiales bacterium]|nr:hypothetical protein [Acidimicrobiales bacterium]